MNLSNKSSDLKLYSRNKYSDGLPYTSDDIHNEQDLTLRKLGLIMDNLIGSGLLEKPSFTILQRPDNIAIRLTKPIPVNLNGEIFLIGNALDGSYPLQIPLGYVGSLVLICWYTNITSNSHLYEYGGLCNHELENDILNEDLSIQTSSRYQVRWTLGYCLDKFDYSNPSIPGNDIVLSSHALILTEKGYTSKNLTIPSKDMTVNGKFYTFPATTDIPSADGYVHLLPLASINNGVISPCNVQLPMSSIESPTTPSNIPHKVWYNPTTEEVKMYFNGDWRNVGGSKVIKQETEPTGIILDGTIWYNPSTGEFRIYVAGVGFVETYAKMGFVQLQATYTFPQDTLEPSDITVNIPIDTYLSSDILRISYEGVELSKGIHYDLNTANKTVTLKDFTTYSGDLLVFSVTRLVGSSDLVTTLSMLEDHVNDIGNNSIFGHLKLSDNSSSVLDQTTGVAATPKLVKSVEDKINKYSDPSNSKVYELGVNNGLLFIREVTD